jgi:transposase
MQRACRLVDFIEGLDGVRYLTDVLQRMVDDHPQNRLDELLPWNWKVENPVNS